MQIAEGLNFSDKLYLSRTDTGGFDEVMQILDVPLLDLSNLSKPDGVFDRLGFEGLDWIAIGTRPTFFGFDNPDARSVQDALGVIKSDASLHVAGLIRGKGENPTAIGISYATHKPTYPHNGELVGFAIPISLRGVSPRLEEKLGLWSQTDLELPQNNFLTWGMITAANINRLPKVIRAHSTTSSLDRLEIDGPFDVYDMNQLNNLGIPVMELDRYGGAQLTSTQQRLTRNYPENLTISVNGNHLDLPTNIKAK